MRRGPRIQHDHSRRQLLGVAPSRRGMPARGPGVAVWTRQSLLRSLLRRLQQNGIVIPAARVAIPRPTNSPLLLQNTTSNGPWSKRQGLPRYRTVNSTARCTGPRAVIFESPPAACVGGEPARLSSDPSCCSAVRRVLGQDQEPGWPLAVVEATVAAACAEPDVALLFDPPPTEWIFVASGGISSVRFVLSHETLVPVAGGGPLAVSCHQPLPLPSGSCRATDMPATLAFPGSLTALSASCVAVANTARAAEEAAAEATAATWAAYVAERAAVLVSATRAAATAPDPAQYPLVPRLAAVRSPEEVLMLAQTLVPEDRSVSSAAASSSALTTPPLPWGAGQPGDLDFLNSVLSEEAGSEAEGSGKRARATVAPEDAPSPGPSPPEPPPPPRQWQSLRRSLSALRQPWSPARTRALWAGWNGCYVAGAFGAAVSHKFAATVLLANSEALLSVFIAIAAGCFIAATLFAWMPQMISLAPIGTLVAMPAVRLWCKLVLLSPAEVDEAIRASSSSPLPVAAACVVVGAGIGAQRGVAYQHRLRAVVLYLVLTCADLGCGARLSGNVAAFHPRFSLPCVFAPSAVGFALMARAVGLRAATAEDDEGVGYAPCPTDAP